MDRQQVQSLLATRASLTGQPFGDRAVDEWHGILMGADYKTARLAVIAAAKDLAKITVADVLGRIPKPATSPHPHRCDECQSTGWVETAPHPGRPCLARSSTGACFCHAVKPCRCPIGQTMRVPA